ncbi:MAG: hypothetical protein VKQ33_11195 [Candidatus Sericytochromatia bacterium]|nr:hypothetical protein [Candidatus Sericytochromatia bacterium]
MSPVNQTPGGSPFQPLPPVPPPPPLAVPTLPPPPPLARDGYVASLEATGGTAAPVQPQAAPAVTDQAAAVTADVVNRLKDWQTMGNAAVELAQLPAVQAVAVARAIFSDPHISNDRAIALVASVVAKRVREPGMLDVMRMLNENPSTSPRTLYQAKLRAAVALLHFGTPADHKGILRLALDPYARDEEKALLFNQITSRADLLQNPATLDVLAAALRAMSVGQQTTIAVSRALARIQHPKARDILGECPAASGGVYRDAPMHALLDALAAHKPPFTPLTIHNLRQVVKKSDPGSVERAKALLKRAGVAP